MTTKTFSSRVDADKLAYADAMARQQFGMSFGQYCGSVLIDAIREGSELPEPNRPSRDDAKADAIARIKSIASLSFESESSRSSTRSTRNPFARRYE